MNLRGRKASLPPADHARPEHVSPDGLVVHHYNRNGRVKDYDFSTLPISRELQAAFARAFAERTRPGGGLRAAESADQAFRWAGQLRDLSHRIATASAPSQGSCTSSRRRVASATLGYLPGLQESLRKHDRSAARAP